MNLRTVRMFSGDRFIPEDKDYERAEAAKSDEQVMDQMLKIQDLDKLCRRCIAFILSSQYGRNIHLWIERAKQLGASEQDITELKFAIIDGFTETSEETISNQALLFASKVALRTEKTKVEKETYEQVNLEQPKETISFVTTDKEVLFLKSVGSDTFVLGDLSVSSGSLLAHYDNLTRSCDLSEVESIISDILASKGTLYSGPELQASRVPYSEDKESTITSFLGDKLNAQAPKDNFDGSRDLLPATETEKVELPEELSINENYPTDDLWSIETGSWLKKLIANKELLRRPGMGKVGKSPSKEDFIKLQEEFKRSPFWNNLTLSSPTELFEPFVMHRPPGSPGRSELKLPDRSDLKLAFSRDYFDPNNLLGLIVDSFETLLDSTESEEDYQRAFDNLQSFNREGSYADWANWVSNRILASLEKLGIQGQQCFESYEEELVIGFDLFGETSGCFLVKLPMGVTELSSIECQTIIPKTDTLSYREVETQLNNRKFSKWNGGPELTGVFYPGKTFYNRIKPDKSGSFGAWDIRLD